MHARSPDLWLRHAEVSEEGVGRHVRNLYERNAAASCFCQASMSKAVRARYDLGRASEGEPSLALVLPAALDPC